MFQSSNVMVADIIIHGWSDTLDSRSFWQLILCINTKTNELFEIMNTKRCSIVIIS